MTDYEILKAIESIDPTNDFLPYIRKRVEDPNYRGIQCSQHNRLTYDYLKCVINSIYKYAHTNKFGIHIGDDDGTQQPAATTYYKIVDDIKTQTGKGTINSIKKNTFPDLARAGILKRYNKKGELIIEEFSIGENKPQQKRQTVYEVQLSNFGEKYATAKTEFERRKYFTDIVDILTKNAATDLVELLSTDERFNDISIDEFQYILSDDRDHILYNDKVYYLSKYRKLSDEQRRNVTSLLKQYCDPKRYKKNTPKTERRDYDNWRNEAQQIFSLLSNSTYFKVTHGILLLNDGQYGLFTKAAKRSQKSKTEYFTYHNITKTDGYELHHIIPFKKAITQQDAQMIDDKRNLIYLSAKKHAEFTATQNVNIRTGYSEPIISFLQLHGVDGIINVDLLHQDAFVSKDHINDMIEYNKLLLQKFYNIE